MYKDMSLTAGQNDSELQNTGVVVTVISTRQTQSKRSCMVTLRMMSRSTLRLKIGNSSRFRRGMFYNYSRQSMERFRLLADCSASLHTKISTRMEDKEYRVNSDRRYSSSVMKRIALCTGYLSTTWSIYRLQNIFLISFLRNILEISKSLEDIISWMASLA